MLLFASIAVDDGAVCVGRRRCIDWCEEPVEWPPGYENADAPKHTPGDLEKLQEHDPILMPWLDADNKSRYVGDVAD